MTTADPVQLIADLFAREGASEYLGEAVTQASHMLQTAALAEADGADDSLVAAALLHDVGHFTGTVTAGQFMAGLDNRHSDIGARWLSQWFGPDVTEPVHLHVAAKRYLCTVEPAYAMTLSDASKFSLQLQGGPMSPPDAAHFGTLPYAQDACRLRRWDDAAKDTAAQPPSFEHYRPLLEALVKADIKSS